MPEELKKKRHRLTKMVYDEISFVDRGANQHANVMIVKREPDGIAKEERKAGWYAADRAPTKSGSGKGAKSERKQNWKEDRHKRKPAGSPAGGEFDKTSSDSKKKYGKGGTTKAKQDAKKKSSTASKSYTVKKGDTLWALAEKYYGDGTKWKLIAKANGVKDPKKLQIGKKLTIPGVTDKKAPKKKAAASSGRMAGTRTVMEPGGRVHQEKIKAKGPRTREKTVKELEAELRAAKTRDAKRKAQLKLKAAQAKKKLTSIRKATGVEKIAAQVMFDEYTGRR